MRKTKIICTIGPATESEEKLGVLIAAGADVFRLNMSHGQPDWVKMVAERIGRELAVELVRAGTIRTVAVQSVRRALRRRSMPRHA